MIIDLLIAIVGDTVVQMGYGIVSVSIAVLEPIRMQAKLSLNQKPETDESNWKIPKVREGEGHGELVVRLRG